MENIDLVINNCLCRRCHRKLKDNKSKELGFGPICYRKYLKQNKLFLFDMGEDKNNEMY